MAIILTQYQGKILGPIAWVLGKVMNVIFVILNTIGIPNVGLCIFIFTVIIYMCLMPLTIKQQKFSKLSAKMNPELQAIQAKYKGNDQNSMMMQQQEIKELYAKYGVSSAGSCVQLLIQMPILFALYRVINAIPAYVTLVKDEYLKLVPQLLSTSGTSEYLQNLSAAQMYKKQFTDAAFSLDSANVFAQNTYIDVLNKATTADWNGMSAAFPSLSQLIDQTHAAILKMNTFLFINIASIIIDCDIILVINAVRLRLFDYLPHFPRYRIPAPNKSFGILFDRFYALMEVFCILHLKCKRFSPLFDITLVKLR